MSIDWDSLTKEEYVNLIAARHQLEVDMADLIQEFVDTTGLEVTGLYLGKPNPFVPFVNDDGSTTPHDHYVVGVHVPMRGMFIEED